MIQTGMSKERFLPRFQALERQFEGQLVSLDTLSTKIEHIKGCDEEQFQKLLDGLEHGHFSQPTGWFRALSYLYQQGELAFLDEASSSQIAVEENELAAQVRELVNATDQETNNRLFMVGCPVFLLALLAPAGFSWYLWTAQGIAWWQALLVLLGLLFVGFMIFGLTYHFLSEPIYWRRAEEFEAVFGEDPDTRRRALEALQGIDKNEARELNKKLLTGRTRRSPTWSFTRPRWLKSVGVLLWLALAVALIAGFRLLRARSQEVDLPRLVELVRQDAVRSLEVQGQRVTVITEEGSFHATKEEGVGILELLRSLGVPEKTVLTLPLRVSSTWMTERTLLLAAPYLLLLLGGGLLVWARSNSAGGSEPKAFWRRDAVPVGEIPRTRFSDIAGYTQTKRELQEIVSYLRNPLAHQAGAEVTRNVLLIGPPGTGKTSLARAVANEAGVPFFALSGSEFIEVYVGVGASRINDLFKEARKKGPSVVFIDEIDAVARKRGDGESGGTQEQDRTLNALLVQLDGFFKEEKPRVFFMAATNREDVLDPALVQRMSRRIMVPLPDEQSREKILRNFAAEWPLAWTPSQIREVAGQTAGYSGRELRNLIEEAARQSDARHAEEARTLCRTKARPGMFQVVSPEETDTTVSPVHIAGCCVAGTGARIQFGKTVIESTDEEGDGIWCAKLTLQPGSHSLTVSDLSGSRMETVRRLHVEAGRKKITFTDVKAALQRLGSAIPHIDTPAEIVRGLDGFVVGQAAPKAVLAAAATAHYTNARLHVDREGGRSLRTGALLVGGTGMGKTLLAQSLARHLRVSFSEVDAPSTLVGHSASFIGPELLRDLLRAAGGKVQKAEYGILCVKSFEKLVGPGSKVDPLWSEQVQQVLADLMAGRTIDVPLRDGRFASSTVPVDTRNILFIFEGSFPKLAEYVGLRLQRGEKRRLPYLNRAPEAEWRRRFALNDEEPADATRLLARVEPDDLERYGFLPQLVACLSQIVVLEDLTESDFQQMLVAEGPLDPMAEHRRILEVQALDLEIADDARKRIAAEAVVLHQGGRGLRGILHRLTLYILSHASSPGSVSVDAEMVEKALAWRSYQPGVATERPLLQTEEPGEPAPSLDLPSL